MFKITNKEDLPTPVHMTQERGTSKKRATHLFLPVSVFNSFGSTMLTQNQFWRFRQVKTIFLQILCWFNAWFFGSLDALVGQPSKLMIYVWPNSLWHLADVFPSISTWLILTLCSWTTYPFLLVFSCLFHMPTTLSEWKNKRFVEHGSLMLIDHSFLEILWKKPRNLTIHCPLMWVFLHIFLASGLCWSTPIRHPDPISDPPRPALNLVLKRREKYLEKLTD